MKAKDDGWSLYLVADVVILSKILTAAQKMCYIF